MNLRLKLYLENDGLFVLGPGRVKLLRSVARLGSLQKAAQDLGMSYRWAWGRLKDAEKALGVPLLAQEEGHARNKGKTLTREAKEILAWIESIENKLDAVLRESLPAHPEFLKVIDSGSG